MSIVSTEGHTTNPELLAIAQRLFGAVQLSVQRASDALHGSAGATVTVKGIEKTAFDFLKTYQSVNRGAVARLAGLSRLGGGAAARALRPLSGVDFSSARSRCWSS